MERERVEAMLAEYQRIMQTQAALFDLLRMEGRIAALQELLTEPEGETDG